MRKALVILTPGFPENEIDSTCVPPQQTFVRMLQRLYPHRQLVVLTFVYPFVSREYQWHGVRVIAFGKPGAGRIYRKLTYLRAWHCLNRLRREYAIQGLLAFWLGPCAWLAARYARRKQLPFYIWLLGQDARAGNKYVRKIKPAARSLIALSDFVSDAFYANYRVRPVRVVPPGIDAGMFGESPGEKDLDLVGAGSFIPLKQYRIFIEMLLRLKEKRPGLRAALCGDGPERAELERYARENGLTETELMFTGRLSHEGILKTMQRARVLLHPSSYEGFGVVCLEALFAGASVVSFVRPMHEPVPGWYLVASKFEMEKTLLRLLDATQETQAGPFAFPLEKTARAINQFFDDSSARDPRTGSCDAGGMAAPLPGSLLPGIAGHNAVAISPT